MKLAVYFHTVIGGSRIPSEDHAIAVLAEQARALEGSGLAASANEIHVGVNGNDSDALLVSALLPFACHLHTFPNGQSEIPTMDLLRHNLKPGWAILYHQMKGVTHPGLESYEIWRRRMEHACVWNWRRCVADLDRGYDAVGCHWLTPERFPGQVTSPFFGGTFWWARSDYLMQLPPLPADTHENRYEAESWIGRRRPYPHVQDYIPGWP